MLSALQDTPVGVVEGGPGFGKSALLRSLQRAWPHDSVWWACADSTPPFDAAAARARMAQCSHAVLLLVDDAHRLGVDQAAELAALCRSLTGGQRVVISTRGDGPVTPKLDQLAGARIEPTALLFSAQETAEALAVRDTRHARLHGAHIWGRSCGWPEGIALTWQRMAATPPSSLSDAILTAAEVVADRAAALDSHTALTLALALSLPRMSPPALAAIPGGTALPTRLMDARLPLARAADGSWWLPAPLTALMERHPLPLAVATAAAQACAQQRRLSEAFALYRLAGEHEQATEILGMMRPGQADALIEEEWQGGLPDAVEAPLRLSLRVLRHAELSHDSELLARLRDRLSVSERRRMDEAELVAAQRARDHLLEGRTVVARAAAKALLANTHDDEVRARCLDILGRAARRGGGLAHLRAAQPLLREAMALWRRLDEPGRVTETRLTLAWVDLQLGHMRRALDRASAVAAELADGAMLMPHVALLRAEALSDLGRSAQAQRLLEHARASSLTPAGFLDTRLAIGCAEAALLAGHEGDARRVLDSLGGVDDWPMDACGARARASVVDLWSRLDLTRAQRAAAALDRLPGDPLPEVRLARAGLAARGGDPEQALRELHSLRASDAVPPRVLWRVHLLSALAASRLRRAAEAADRLAAALEAAGAIGQAQAPFMQEKQLTRELLARHPVRREPVR